MPFVSEAQRRYMWANHPEMAREFQDATPKGKKLPEHVKTKKATMEKTAEPPPPEGVSTADWDRHLSTGGKVEMEHKDTIAKIKSHPDIPVEAAANSIASDHEEELGKDYYPALKGMEAALETTKKAAFWDEMQKIAHGHGSRRWAESVWNANLRSLGKDLRGREPSGGFHNLFRETMKDTPTAQVAERALERSGAEQATGQGLERMIKTTLKPGLKSGGYNTINILGLKRGT